MAKAYAYPGLVQPSTIQLQTFPGVPEPNTELRATSGYVKATSARNLSAHAGQQKRLTKGKGLLFDRSKDKRLNIYVAKSWPTWQEKYIDLVRELFDGVTLDAKTVAKRVEKAEMKKAMPFIQELKRRLESGESRESVLDRALSFDEVQALKEMVPVLKSTVPKLKEVGVIVIDKSNGGGLPRTASSAEPGSPSLEFLDLNLNQSNQTQMSLQLVTFKMKLLLLQLRFRFYNTTCMPISCTVPVNPR